MNARSEDGATGVLGPKGWLTIAAVCLALALGVLADAPLARRSLNDGPLRFLQALLDATEPFGHGYGVAMIAVTVYLLDPAHRRAVVWILAGAWGAGLAANVVKSLIARRRPWSWLEQVDQHRQNAWDSFFAWLPLGEGGSACQSFPSAHTATAFGLAVMLSIVYPRGKAWFFILATLVGAQRVAGHAHFVTDVMVGGLLGWLVAQIVAHAMNRMATPRVLTATKATA